MSRNKEVASSKLTGRITALSRKPHLNVNSGVTTKGSQSHDLEGNTKQLPASRFKEPLDAQSSRYQYHEIIRLDSLEEHDPFEIEMQSAQKSAGSYRNTEDFAANFTDQ